MSSIQEPESSGLLDDRLPRGLLESQNSFWTPTKQTALTSIATASLFAVGAELVRRFGTDGATLLPADAAIYYLCSGTCGLLSGICADRVFSFMTSKAKRCITALTVSTLPTAVLETIFSTLLSGSDCASSSLVHTFSYWTIGPAGGLIISASSLLAYKMATSKRNYEEI